MNYILLTGVTGFVGSALCQQLLMVENNFLYLLARGRGGVSADDRVHRELAKQMKGERGWENRIRVIDGELTEDCLGIESTEYEGLLQILNVVYHCAASIKFTLSYEDAKRINCKGTESVVELVRNVKNPAFDRLNYVSTSYIAGSIVEGFSETDLENKQKFSNTYEQTKYECEVYLQSQIARGVPITIYRPSIVTSSSIDGSTHKNNIIYKFIKMIQMEAVEAFYCEDNTSVNMVPVDYVIAGILALSKKNTTIGKTYHLVNKDNTNVKSAVTTACGEFGIKVPSYLDFSNIDDLQGNPMYSFFHYAKMSHHFQDVVTRSELEQDGILCGTTTSEYFVKHIQYCMENKLLKERKAVVGKTINLQAVK